MITGTPPGKGASVSACDKLKAKYDASIICNEMNPMETTRADSAHQVDTLESGG